MASFLKPVRRNAGLGDPPDPYYNNIPESANAIIKRAVEYEPKEMSNFITEMEGLITQQKKDCEAAVINRGPYTLVDEEKSLEIPPEKWFKMNVNQREHALQKYWKTRNQKQESEISKDDKKCQEKDQFQNSSTLSVDPEQSGLAGIPLLLLKDIFSEASKLLATEAAILPAPSLKESSFVVRNDNGARPYFVFQEANGKVVCEECERYKSAKICCHSVAVAEKCGTLEKFISWYRRSPQTITATSFLTSDTSKTVGRKGDQEKSSTQRRKGGRSKAQRSETVTTVQRAYAPPSQPLRHVQANTVSSYGASPLITLPTRPHSPATTLVHSSGLPDQPPINRRNYPSPSYGSFVIYPLSMCPPQVSTCYGCSAPLKPAGQIAPPPGDLVIVSNMLRSFTKNNMEYRKPSNVYFHCNTKCVQARQPYFLGVLCQIPFEVLNCISDQHRAYLRMNLGLSV